MKKWLLVALLVLPSMAHALGPHKVQTVISGGSVVLTGVCKGVTSITSAGAVTLSVTEPIIPPPGVKTNGCVAVICNTGADTITIPGTFDIRTEASLQLTVAKPCVEFVGANFKWYQQEHGVSHATPTPTPTATPTVTPTNTPI